LPDNKSHSPGGLGRACKVWAIGASAAVLCLYALGLLYEGFIAGKYSDILTYPFADKPAAQRAYDGLGPTTPAGARGAAAGRLARANPADPESWNAVAYADWLEHRGLTRAGLLALDHSYALAFFDRHQAVWRVSFALENWQGLTPELRKDVLEEAAVALRDADLRPRLSERLRTVQSPAGRFAAALIRASNRN
jgi:hypothetical protein